MSVVIPESKTYNRVFKSPSALVRFVEEKSQGFDTDSNAFTFMCRVSPHKKGYKLLTIFVLDNGLVSQMQRENSNVYTYNEIMYEEFVQAN